MSHICDLLFSLNQTNNNALYKLMEMTYREQETNETACKSDLISGTHHFYRLQDNSDIALNVFLFKYDALNSEILISELHVLDNNVIKVQKAQN